MDFIIGNKIFKGPTRITKDAGDDRTYAIFYPQRQIRFFWIPIWMYYIPGWAKYNIIPSHSIRKNNSKMFYNLEQAQEFLFRHEGIQLPNAPKKISEVVWQSNKGGLTEDQIARDNLQMLLTERREPEEEIELFESIQKRLNNG